MDLLGLSKEREELSHEPLLKQGMVLKCGRKVTSQWKKRYFVLRPTTLSYHAGMDTDRAERRYIEITQNTTVTLRPDKHPLAFQVRTPGFRKITARCETEEELNLWISAIEECIKRAPAWPIKCVVVGDDEEYTSGKRVLVHRYLEACKGKMEDGEAKMTNSHGYTLNKSRTRIVKTPDELGNVDILLEYEKGEWIKLMLWHLDGSEECTKLRALAYPNTDIFIIVFSVSSAKSFEKVESYLKEIKAVANRASSTAPAPIYLLVGTRVSSELVAIGFQVAEDKARSLGFSGYVECRVDTLEDCEQMFTDAVRLVVEKTEVVFTGSEGVSDHARQGSGFLGAIAARLRKKAIQEDKAESELGRTPPSQTTLPGGDGSSPDVSPSNSKRRGFFTGSSERLVSAAMSPGKSSLSKRADPINQSTESSSKSMVRSSAADGDEDSDEGSLIGVEVDETEEEAKARAERDFGLTSMKEDAQYTQKVLSRTNSRRSGDQPSHSSSHRSMGKELFDIEETAAEDRERELEELRQRDAKRERELERMKMMMDSLKSLNKTVEEQLRAMREELAVLNKKSGGKVNAMPAIMTVKEPIPALKLPPSTASPTLHSTTSDLPPRPPLSLAAQAAAAPGSGASPATKASFRSNRGMSVFF
jgi:GTPase SAR1 family protein